MNNYELIPTAFILKAVILTNPLPKLFLVGGFIIKLLQFDSLLILEGEGRCEWCWFYL